MTAIVYHNGRMYADRKIIRFMPHERPDYRLGSKLTVFGSSWCIGVTGDLPVSHRQQLMLLTIAEAIYTTTVGHESVGAAPRFKDKEKQKVESKRVQNVLGFMEKDLCKFQFLAANKKIVIHFLGDKDQYSVYSPKESVGIGSNGYSIAKLLEMGMKPKEAFKLVSKQTWQVSEEFHCIYVGGLEPVRD